MASCWSFGIRVYRARMTAGAQGEEYLEACRVLVLDQIRTIIHSATYGDKRTYELMVDYPLRRAKGLRPALCIAVARALGSELHEVLPSAAIIEIYHNAFLIHDDIEDGSLERRGAPALHHVHGTPIAINVGDGLLAMAMRPLLANTEKLGLGRALRILEIVADMVTRSFEGQALELRWIADGAWELTDADYELMALSKTCWYSFVAPALVGAAVAKTDRAVQERLISFMKELGLAFQIRDDLLNLEARGDAYGKEPAGDLWEGKRTLMLLHALRSAPPDDRARALEILAKPRPRAAGDVRDLEVRAVLAEMAGEGVIGVEVRSAIEERLDRRGSRAREKTDEDVFFLRVLIERHRGIEHAREVALRHANAADALWGELARDLPASAHVRFIGWLKDYVLRREW